MKKLLVALVAATLTASAPVPAAAQAASASPVIGKQVFVRIELNDEKSMAYFDTDGQSVGGLSEAALLKKFAKFSSPASLVNFMAEQGYRVTQFTAVPAGTTRYGGGNIRYGSYIMLFEQLSR